MPATINATMTLLLHELAEEIPDALAAELPLYAVWNDLCRIAGEIPPRDVAAALDAPLALVPLVPVPTDRGGAVAIYAD
jgi:hypothetical protein